MKFTKITTSVVSAFAALGLAVLFMGNVASALAPTTLTDPDRVAHSTRHRFEATGKQTSFFINITNPPQVGQYFILEEDLFNSSNVKIGTDHITCVVTGFTATALKFACTGQYFLAGGSLKVITKFEAPFSPAGYPIFYDAKIFGGTGAYSTARGVIHVTDSGPGNDTGYKFDFVTL